MATGSILSCNVKTYAHATGTPTGTFTIGETVTQATSGATAVVVAAPATTVAGSLVLRNITGSPDASHTWTGGTSGATFVPSAAPVHFDSYAEVTVEGFTTGATYDFGYDPGTAAPAVTAYTGTGRNNFTASLGCFFTLAAPALVSRLGRMRYAGNAASHTVKIVSTDNATTYASASIDMSSGTVGAFKYAGVPPFVLPAGQYAIVSSETDAGDAWGDNTGSITAAAGVTIDTGAFTTGGVFSTNGAGKSYVGVDFQFSADATLNPGASTPYLTVTSEGYDAAGVLGTVTRTVYLTQVLRKPFPAEASGSTGAGATKDETGGGNLTVRVALSEPVYADDRNGGAGTSGTDPALTAPAGWVTNSGGAGQTSLAAAALVCTNTSGLAYPKVVGRWGWPGFERQTGDAAVEAVCFHAYARAGKPVACVKFDAADAHSNNAAQQTATAMTQSARASGDAKKVSAYPATIPVTSLTQGDAVTCRFRAYPWVGDASAVLDTDTGADGVAAPDERLTPWLFHLDKSDTLALYASVDGTNGSAGGVCSSSKATARATPFQTLAQAMTALKADATRGFSTLDATYVLMQNGTYTGPGTFTGGNTKSRCTVMADTANGATEAGVVFSTSANTACAAYLKFQDVTFSGSGTGMLRGDATAGAVWLHSCTLNHTSTSFCYTWRLCEATQNTVTALTQGFLPSGANASPFGLVRGNVCASGVGADLYCVLGNTNVVGGFKETGNAAGQRVSDNAIYAWNAITAGASQGEWAKSTAVAGGLAVVGNLFEKTEAGTPLLQLAADGASGASVDHVLLWHNTFAGPSHTDGRLNLAYNDTGSTCRPRRNWSVRYNLGDQYNNKDDTFPTASGPRIGAWPQGYGMSSRGNVWLDSLFPPEFYGPGTRPGGAAGYTNDLTGSTGGGDYSLTSSSNARNRIPAGLAVIPYDLTGQAFDNGGGGSAGALQRAADIVVAPTGGASRTTRIRRARARMAVAALARRRGR